MKKYKDSFDTHAETLEKGGGGILTVVTNENPHENVVPVRPRAVPQPKTTSTISPIRTLADDLERSARDNKVTLSQQALKNSSTTHTETPERGPETNQKARTYAYARKSGNGRRLPKSLLFLLLTLIIFGSSLYLFASRQEIGMGNFKLPISLFGTPNENHATTELGVPFPETHVHVDGKKELFIESSTNRTSLKTMLNEESRVTQRGALTALFPAERIETERGGEVHFITMAPLFEIIDISIRNVLLRNIDTYTLGVSGASEAGAFLVANIHSYEEVFGKLLEWERTMPRELYGFFHNNLSFAVGQSIPPFRDVIVSGHDARVLTSADEGDILIYSLVNNKTLVITHSREELARIISRLQ